MPDVLGWRCKFGAIGPSTNTVVQPDFDAMRPAGVTNHYSRIYTPNAAALSNETFRAGVGVIDDTTTSLPFGPARRASRAARSTLIACRP